MRLNVIAFTLLATSLAFAKPKTIREELPDGARRRWDTAIELYGVGDFEGARAEFQRVFEATQNPRVLYNVAVCHKDLKHYKAAAETLRRALAMKATVPADDVAQMQAALAAVEPFITKVEILVSEPGASLAIDDIDVGKTPFAQPVEVDAGSHVVRLSKSGFVDVVRKVTFTTADSNKLELVLEPTVRRSHVHVQAVGATNATIWIDGRETTLAPFDGELEVGPHEIEARAPDCVPTKQHVTVVWKEAASFTLALGRVRHEGVLRVVATPSAAAIEIDGKIVGHGEWEGPLASKNGHTLTVKRDGFNAYTTEIVLDDESHRVVPVTLIAEKTWIYWAIGATVVVAGGVAATYFALRTLDRPVVPGTLAAGGAGYGLARFGF